METAKGPRLSRYESGKRGFSQRMCVALWYSPHEPTSPSVALPNMHLISPKLSIVPEMKMSVTSWYAPPPDRSFGLSYDFAAWGVIWSWHAVSWTEFALAACTTLMYINQLPFSLIRRDFS